MLIKNIVEFFDKLEDKIRGKLSHYPILYAIIGGIGIVLFWRGVWHTTDFFSNLIISFQQNISIDLANMAWWDGPLSLLLGSILLLSTGLFVFGFIGNETIISGLKGEKRLAEKTEEEVKSETSMVKEIKEDVEKISNRISNIEKNLEKK
jgi:hypothetical protein